MESQTHTLANLFAQLGLPNEPRAPSMPSSPPAPLPDAIPLAEAAFWTPSQAAFLKAEIAEDADWSAVVDSLNLQLRRRLTRLLRQQEALGSTPHFRAPRPTRCGRRRRGRACGPGRGAPA
jgi:hypothetical protein